MPRDHPCQYGPQHFHFFCLARRKKLIKVVCVDLGALFRSEKEMSSFVCALPTPEHRKHACTRRGGDTNNAERFAGKHVLVCFFAFTCSAPVWIDMGEEGAEFGVLRECLVDGETDRTRQNCGLVCIAAF